MYVVCVLRVGRETSYNPLGSIQTISRCFLCISLGSHLPWYCPNSYNWERHKGDEVIIDGVWGDCRDWSPHRAQRSYEL